MEGREVVEGASAAPAISRAFALIQVLALNGVPLYGVYALGWSWGTVLALYWCETLLGTFFITLRMVLHRRLTHKRGYYRPQLGIKQNDKPFSAFLPEFVTGSLAFNLAHGLFLAVILGLMLKDRPDVAVHLPSLRKGLAAMALIMTGSFALDCQNLRDRPFAWIRNLAQRSVGRTIVIHLAIIFGMAGIMFFDIKQAPFAVFAVLKLLLELGYLSTGKKTPKEAPAWAAKIGGIVPGGEEGFKAQYRKEVGREERLAAKDEEEMGRGGNRR
ncbi:MAG TPA: DUF6498-containing protein [Thermoanaerobaculia bacterium]|nr:DUF6498-containing protein [Thermoanaerobaculia bacterium]